MGILVSKLTELNGEFPDRETDTLNLIAFYGETPGILYTLRVLYSAAISYEGCKICIANHMSPDDFIGILRGYE